MEDEKKQRIRYYAFAAFVGVLLLLNWLGIFKTFFGIDTAIFITLMAGYKTFYNSFSALLERRISADIALCVAVTAALAEGQYMAAAEAMFIVLVGEGLESFAAGRTQAAIEKFVEQLPRIALLFRDGREEEISADLLLAGDLIIGARATAFRPTESSNTAYHSSTKLLLPVNRFRGKRARRMKCFRVR
jgi:cation transport ATPase